MSYDQCGKRWGESCPSASRYPIDGSPVHFCGEMVGRNGDDCGGPHKCSCGATSHSESRAERRRRERGDR